MSSSGDWALYYTAEGHPYYYNHTTGESQWAQVSTQSNNHEANCFALISFTNRHIRMTSIIMNTMIGEGLKGEMLGRVCRGGEDGRVHMHSMERIWGKKKMMKKTMKV